MIRPGFAPLDCMMRSTHVVNIAPEGDLPLDADVPQPDGEGEEQPRGGQEQRHPGDQHVGDHFPGAHGARDDVGVGGEGRSLRDNENDGGEQERQDDGRGLEERVLRASATRTPPPCRNAPTPCPR